MRLYTSSKSVEHSRCFEFNNFHKRRTDVECSLHFNFIAIFKYIHNQTVPTVNRYCGSSFLSTHNQPLFALCKNEDLRVKQILWINVSLLNAKRICFSEKFVRFLFLYIKWVLALNVALADWKYTYRSAPLKHVNCAHTYQRNTWWKC